MSDTHTVRVLHTGTGTVQNCNTGMHDTAYCPFLFACGCARARGIGGSGLRGALAPRADPPRGREREALGNQGQSSTPQVYY